MNLLPQRSCQNVSCTRYHDACVSLTVIEVWKEGAAEGGRGWGKRVLSYENKGERDGGSGAEEERQDPEQRNLKRRRFSQRRRIRRGGVAGAGAGSGLRVAENKDKRHDKQIPTKQQC